MKWNSFSLLFSLGGFFAVCFTRYFIHFEPSAGGISSVGFLPISLLFEGKLNTAVLILVKRRLIPRKNWDWRLKTRIKRGWEVAIKQFVRFVLAFICRMKEIYKLNFDIWLPEAIMVLQTYRPNYSYITTTVTAYQHYTVLNFSSSLFSKFNAAIWSKLLFCMGVKLGLSQ
jgi:hypothetical protein